MVKNGHSRVPKITFAPSVGTTAGIEVVSLSRLHSKDRRGGLGAPQRPNFHHVIAVQRGQLRHSVDFDVIVAAEGSWLWTRPGQVLQWDEPGDAEATVIMFESAAIDSETLLLARVDGLSESVLRLPAEPDATRLAALLDHLRGAFEDAHLPPLKLRTATVRHLLDVVLLALAQSSSDSIVDGSSDSIRSTFRQLQAEVEKRFASTRRVDDYARALGYSPRTLTRASEAVAGISAKRLIDQRVVLEAQRLLGHTNRDVGAISASLGFSSATNFAKFFRHHTGVTPSEFRAQI